MSNIGLDRSNNLGPIHVLMVAQELGWGGGIERDVSKFARYISQFDIHAHVACFKTGGARWTEISDAGIPLITIPFEGFLKTSLAKASRKLIRYLRENRIALVHAFDLNSNLFAVPVARLAGVPVVLASQVWLREILPISSRAMSCVVDRVATDLFVNCHAVEKSLTAKWWVPAERIQVCHNGFEPREFNAEGRERPRELCHASVVVGTVAVLREEKNISMLIDAFAQLYHLDPNARLLIVGDGPLRSDLISHARALVGDACIFCGATLEPATWMRAIDVFVLPSRSESFSNALLEAMACGCCPVASNVGGSPELVKSGESGFLFSSGNCAELASILCNLSTNKNLRVQMAEAARRFAFENHTISIAAARLAAIYRNLIEQRQTSVQHKEFT